MLSKLFLSFVKLSCFFPEKSIAVSTITDSIDSVKYQLTIDYRACNNRDRLIVSTFLYP